MHNTTRAALTGAAMLLGLGVAAQAAETPEPIERDWHQGGMFGTFDRSAVQRGYQVFKEVCHSCHSLNYMAFRNLESLGYTEEQVQALAGEFTVPDGPNDAGEMFERPARPYDKMPPAFPNAQAARAANGGALPPDLSLIVKAREGAENYVHSLLVGYDDPPADFKVPDGLYYNRYFAGRLIAMPPPLSPDQVTYSDGTSATVDQMSSDVTQFLAFIAEPKLEERKQLGLRALIFLVTLSGILYAYKRKVWADVH